MRFEACETFSSLDDAKVGIDLLGGSMFKYMHNYGNKGCARIYHCVSHTDCPKRLGFTKFQQDPDGSVQFTLEVAETHSREMLLLFVEESMVLLSERWTACFSVELDATS
ncbi:hypothetical protein P3T76_004817 [Phytophthora citrophthora]|uniref:Uncharacterized protein n=1 Tax=Phytophthora citrophthora TaxID=4793 RepID=A0AAD9GRZ9_9STRA|nr:hypothetical protein P3T76_004817 [Phytophthora citrophthora]